jgi:hypothetical protein
MGTTTSSKHSAEADDAQTGNHWPETMKTASTLLQVIALGACFVNQVEAPAEFRMPGVRQALRTIAGPDRQPLLAAIIDVELADEA